MDQPVKKSLLRSIVDFPLSRIIIAIAFFVLGGIIINLIVGHFKSSAEITLIGDPLTILFFSLAYFGFVKLIERRPVTELSFNGALKGISLGLFYAVIMVAFVYGGLFISGCLKITGINPVSYMLLPFLSSLRAGIWEELLFRGVLYRIIEEKLGTVISLIITSVIFGGIHLLNPNATLMGAVSIALTAGLILGLIMTLTKQLWASMALHFCWNFLTGGVFGTAVSGNEKSKALFNNTLEGPEILTGGAFGPEASILIIIIGLIMSRYLFRKIKREGKLVLPYWKLREQTQ